MNIKKIIVAALLVLLGWYAFFGQNVMGKNKRAQEYLASITKITSSDIGDAIRNNKSQTKVLYFYSSTSILSRMYFGDIVDIAREYQPKGVLVIAVSVDKYPILLASYLMNKDLPFKALLLNESSSNGLSVMLRSFRIHYSGEPYTVIIDRSGSFKEFEPGSGFMERIKEYLSKNS